MKNYKVSKEFVYPYHLNQHKATRINEIIENHIRKLQPVTERNFVIQLSNDKRINCDNFHDIFQLDNGKKNRIQELDISWTAKDCKVAIVFHQYIEVEVDGSDYQWVSEVFAEIEEQIERTRSSHFINKIKGALQGLVGFTFSLLIIGFALSFFMNGSVLDSEEKNISFTPEEKEKLIKLSKNVDNEEDKINFIYEAMVGLITEDEVIKNKESSTNVVIQFFITWKNYLVIIPSVLFIVCFIYLVYWCYPDRVFEWGDMVDDFKRIELRRNYLWNILFGSFIIGVLSNLFAYAITT